jgi:hypothetical protein
MPKNPKTRREPSETAANIAARTLTAHNRLKSIARILNNQQT